MRALVTGATGNVGRAMIDGLIQSERYWEIVGVSRSKVAWHNPRCTHYPLNLLIQSDVADFLGSYAPFDLVVMAHGVQQPCIIGQSDFIDTYYTVMDGNLTSTVYLTQELIEQGALIDGALIVYCSSIQATQTRAGRGAYGIAKAGIEALARTVAIEQAPKIRSVGLRLGQLDATMRGITFSPDQLKTITDRLPLPLVKCENVAKLILSLYEQTEMTGVVLDVDSGHHLNIWPT